MMLTMVILINHDNRFKPYEKILVNQTFGNIIGEIIKMFETTNQIINNQWSEIIINN